MKQKENNPQKKAKWQIPAIIVWIIGGIISVVFMMERFLAIGEEYETTSDCLVDGIRYALYLAAFITGLIYLFNKKQNKIVVISAVIYACVAFYNIFAELFDGGTTSVSTIIVMLITLLVYIASAYIIKAYTYGSESGLGTIARKFWYLPTCIQLLSALVQSINTEINDTHGFDFSLVIIDMLLAIVLILPIFTMTLAVKERSKTE